jgi:hypothetical protein
MDSEQAYETQVDARCLMRMWAKAYFLKKTVGHGYK